MIQIQSKPFWIHLRMYIRFLFSRIPKHSLTRYEVSLHVRFSSTFLPNVSIQWLLTNDVHSSTKPTHLLKGASVPSISQRIHTNGCPVAARPCEVVVFRAFTTPQVRPPFLPAAARARLSLERPIALRKSSRNSSPSRSVSGSTLLNPLVGLLILLYITMDTFTHSEPWPYFCTFLLLF